MFSLNLDESAKPEDTHVLTGTVGKYIKLMYLPCLTIEASE